MTQQTISPAPSGSSSSQGQPLLRVRDLQTEFSTSRGKIRTTRGISFDVYRGEMLGVVGESGCGKSVMIRSILGLLPETGSVVGGSVELEGSEILGLNARKLREIRGSRIGFVSQNPFSILNPVLRVSRQFHIMLSTHNRSVTRRQSYARAAEVLEQVGIAGVTRVLDGYAHELSGGMAQRVGIAMALVLDPRIIIADEPTTALDIIVQRQILELLAEINSRDNAVVLVTHDLGVVAQYCDRVVVLYAGKAVEIGPVAEVFTRPSHPYTRGLLQAVPRPGKELVGLGGSLPSFYDYPTGCSFAARCQFAYDRCAHEAPDMRAELGRQSIRACHLDSEGVVGRGGA